MANTSPKSSPNTSPTLTPRLVVSNSAEAIVFYREVFGAKELERYASPNGVVIHAAISIGDAVISLADAHLDWYPPAQADGSPILLTLRCDDPDATAKRAEDHGATILIPVADRFYGHREGRIQDPFGHLWILSRVVREMSPAEIQSAVDNFDLS